MSVKPAAKQGGKSKGQLEVQNLRSSPKKGKPVEEESLGNIMAKLASSQDYGDEYGEEEVVPIKAKQFLFGAVDSKQY